MSSDTQVYEVEKHVLFSAGSIARSGTVRGLLGYVGYYVYAIVVSIIFHLRVVLYEEPEMERLFPQDWVDYRDRVLRWLFRVTPNRRSLE